MDPNIHPLAVPRVTRGVPLFPLLLLSCMVLSSLADSLPSFIISPENQAGVYGEVASFVCQARGDPRPRITWTKKNLRLASLLLESVEFDNGSGSVLRIPSYLVRDKATYECTASNSVGEITSSAKVTMFHELETPQGFPTIDSGPQLRVVEKGRTALMFCTASGNPDPKISWYKDWVPVDLNNSTGRFKILRSGALQIENSEESDQGKYECVATNSAGTRYSAPANLYVRVRRVPPRFSIPPTNQEVMPGGSVNLTCVAVGSPMPFVKWMLGSEDLTREDEIPMGRNVLQLTNIRESANYTCVAMSSLGMIETTAEVTVKGLKPPTSLTVTETTANSVTLTWDSGNLEPVSYYIIMYKDKSSDSYFQKLEGITTTRYSISDLSPYSEYEFRVTAVNDFGHGPSSDPVLVQVGEQAPSSPPLNVKFHFLSANTMLVQWERPLEPNGVIIGYRVYYSADKTSPLSLWKQINTTSSSMVITGLIPNTTYSLSVLGFTSVGDGPLSDIFQLKTRPQVPAQPSSIDTETEQDNGNVLTSMPPAPPRDLKVEVLNSTTIRVTWKPPLQQKQTFRQIQGYQVIFSRLENGEPQGQPSIMNVALPETLEAIIGGLHPKTTYSVTVAAYMAEGDGARCKAKVITTTGEGSGELNMMITITMKNTALIQWRPPQEMVGDLIGYRLLYKRTDDDSFISLEFSRNINRYTVTGLHKGTTYVFQLSARTHAGFGEASTIVISTPEDVPSGFPVNLQMTEKTQSSIHVTWEPPLPAEQNGKIIDYLVMYGDVDSRQTGTIKTRETHVTIQGLSPDTTYDIRVQAFNSKGAGPVSPSIQSRTMSEGLQSP